MRTLIYENFLYLTPLQVLLSFIEEFSEIPPIFRPKHEVLDSTFFTNKLRF